MGAKRKCTVHEAAIEWLQYCSDMGLRPTTLRSRCAYVSGYLSEGPLARRLTHGLEPGAFQGIHNKRAAGRHGKPRPAPLGPGTQKNYRAMLKLFLSWCEMNDLLSHGPLHLLSTVPNPPRHQTKKERLSARKMLAALDANEHPRDRMLIALEINTASRVSELVTLRLGDIDLDRLEINMTIHKTRKFDTFPITAELEHELRRYLTWYAEEAAREGMGALQNGWYLLPAKWSPQFARLNGGPAQRVHTGPIRPTDPIGMRTAIRVAKDTLDAIGVSAPGQATHCFRRSSGTLYYETLRATQGGDHALRETQAFLNHDSVASTQTYLDIDHEKRRRNDRLRGKPFLSAMIDDSNVVPLAAPEVAAS